MYDLLLTFNLILIIYNYSLVFTNVLGIRRISLYYSLFLFDIVIINRALTFSHILSLDNTYVYIYEITKIKSVLIIFSTKKTHVLYNKKMRRYICVRYLYVNS